MSVRLSLLPRPAAVPRVACAAGYCLDYPQSIEMRRRVTQKTAFDPQNIGDESPHSAVFRRWADMWLPVVPEPSQRPRQRPGRRCGRRASRNPSIRPAGARRAGTARRRWRRPRRSPPAAGPAPAAACRSGTAGRGCALASPSSPGIWLLPPVSTIAGSAGTRTPRRRAGRAPPRGSPRRAGRMIADQLGAADLPAVVVPVAEDRRQLDHLAVVDARSRSAPPCMVLSRSASCIETCSPWRDVRGHMVAAHAARCRHRSCASA